MFDKTSFFSHIKTADNNLKMTRAGVKTSFYEEREDIQEAIPAVLGLAARGLGKHALKAVGGFLGKKAIGLGMAAMGGAGSDHKRMKNSILGQEEEPVVENTLNDPVQPIRYGTKIGGKLTPGGGPLARARSGEPIENILGRPLKDGEIAGKAVTTDVALNLYDRMQRKGGQGVDPNKLANAALDMASRSTAQTTPASEVRRKFVEKEKGKERIQREAGMNDSYDPTSPLLIEERKKRITKSHGKEYPKGTHYCATHVEHADWGMGRTVHGEHAAPDAEGNIEWYNVMFEHGVETVDTSDLIIHLAEAHENHEHHDQTGYNLTEQGLRDMIKLMVIGRETEEAGEKTPGRGSSPTDHNSIGGKPRRDTGRVAGNPRRPGDDSVLGRMGRTQIARQYRTGKRFDPNYRRSDAEKDLFRRDDTELF